MLENSFSFKKFLFFLVLCSVSVVVVYQWRVQHYTVRFVSWNSTNSNTTSLLYDAAWSQPLPAVGHLHIIRNSTVLGSANRNSTVLEDVNKNSTVLGNANKNSTVLGDANRNSTVLRGANITEHHVIINTPSLSHLTTKEGRLVNKNTTIQSVVQTTKLGQTVNTTATTTPRPVLTTTPVTCKDPFRKEYTEKSHFLCCHPIGGLGNNMFVYASAYGIATKLNRTLVLNRKSNVNTFFSLTSRIRTVEDYDCVVRGSKGRGSRIDCGFDKGMFDIPRGDNYCVGMYLQSYKYFEHVKQDIRKQFTFKKELRDKAKNIIDKAVKTFDQRINKTDQSVRPVLVGVHVRRGDLVNNRYGYDVATPEYMDKAMNYFRVKYGAVLFIACSNGMDWVKKHAKGDDVIYVEGNNYDVDMAVLVSCDHTLSTVGSFGWWVGYLTEGETVYYQWPAKEGSHLRRHFSNDYSDFFPPTWIGMR